MTDRETSDCVELASFGSGHEAPKFHPSDDSACVDDSLDLSMSTVGGAGASRKEGHGAFSDARGREHSCVWRFTATDVDDAYSAFLFNEKTEIGFVCFGKHVIESTRVSGVVGFNDLQHAEWVERFMCADCVEIIRNPQDDDSHTEILDDLYEPIAHIVSAMDGPKHVTLDAHEDDMDTDDEMLKMMQCPVRWMKLYSRRSWNPIRPFRRKLMFPPLSIIRSI